MTKINSNGEQSANSNNGSSTQVTGHSTTVNNFTVSENMEDSISQVILKQSIL